MDQKHEAWKKALTCVVTYWIATQHHSPAFWKERTKEILKELTRDKAVQRLAEELRQWCEQPRRKPGSADDALLSSALDCVHWCMIAESMIENAEPHDLLGAVIHVYTRKQALADGLLRDAGKLAAEAGFRVPVALTSAVWEAYVRVPEAVSWQDETGRLWDILTMLRHAIRTDADRSETHFKVLVQNDERPELLTLKAISGPGDDGEHVITILLPDED